MHDLSRNAPRDACLQATSPWKRAELFDADGQRTHAASTQASSARTASTSTSTSHSGFTKRVSCAIVSTGFASRPSFFGTSTTAVKIRYVRVNCRRASSARLSGEGRGEPEAGFAVWEDPDDSRSAFDLLVEAFQGVGGPDLAAVRLGEREVCQGVLDAVLGPPGDGRVAGAPMLHGVASELHGPRLLGAAWTAFRSLSSAVRCFFAALPFALRLRCT